MSQRMLYVTLAAPNGVVFEITDRIVDVRSITEDLEQDLLTLVHSDMDIDLDDSDGSIEDLLTGAATGDVYTVEVWRDSGRRRPLCDLLFAGILDIPGSIRYDRPNGEVALQVFAFSKLLERESADALARSISGVTASVSAASAVVTLSDTTGLVADDIIKLQDGTNSEEAVILSVDSGTQVTTVDTFDNAFTGADLELLTVFPRRKSIDYLAGLLFTAAGLDDYTINTNQQISSYPIATEINTDGLPSSAPRSLVDEAGNLTTTHPTVGRFLTTDVQSGFSAGAATTTAQGDWRPYLASEPGAIVANGTEDTGATAWDHAGAHYWTWDETFSGGPGFTTTLRLLMDGGLVTTVAGFSDPSETGFAAVAVEYDPVNDYVWISYDTGAGGTATRIWDVGGAAFLTNPNSIYGGLRVIAPTRSVMLQHSTTSLKLYDLTTRVLLKTVTVPAGLVVWSVREVNGQFVAIYGSNGTARVRIWDDTWVEVADYNVASMFSTRNLLTVYTTPEGEDIGVGFAGGVYFVLSSRFLGVVPYADFEGMTCADALRELALLCMGFVTVGKFHDAYLIGRSTNTANATLAVLETPLEHEHVPIWESYRARIVVTGATEGGVEIEEIAGDDGSEADRLEIDSRLITNGSQAEAIGQLYLGFLGTERTQDEITIREPVEPIGALDVVELDGERKLIVRSEINVNANEQRLTLVGI